MSSSQARRSLRDDLKKFMIKSLSISLWSLLSKNLPMFPLTNLLVLPLTKNLRRKQWKMSMVILKLLLHMLLFFPIFFVLLPRVILSVFHLPMVNPKVVRRDIKLGFWNIFLLYSSACSQYGVSPTQLHPNSICYMTGFYLVCMWAGWSPLFVDSRLVFWSETIIHFASILVWGAKRRSKLFFHEVLKKLRPGKVYAFVEEPVDRPFNFLLWTESLLPQID